jgi:hypothetical protein
MLKHIKEYEEFEGQSLNEGIGDLWDRFKRKMRSIFSSDEPVKKKVPPQVKKKNEDLLLGDHMLYLPHQQGPAGTAEIISVLRGKSKLSTDMRNKLLNNMPSSDPRYNRVKSGKDKDAAMAFLEYQKSTWDQYKEEALLKIKEPQNSKVKKALESIPNRKLPIDFLTTVAYKESRFVPEPKSNPSYRGLFQIGDLAWKQLKQEFPEKYKGAKAPLDPFKNAQAGHDFLDLSYEAFDKKVSV